MKPDTGAICGGQHQARVWTKREISKHLESPCIDCYCEIPFKQEEASRG